MSDSCDSEYLSDEADGKTAPTPVKIITKHYSKSSQKTNASSLPGRKSTAASHVNYKQPITLLDFYFKRKRGETTSVTCTSSDLPPEKFHKGDAIVSPLTIPSKSPVILTTDTTSPPLVPASQELSDSDMDDIRSYLDKLDEKMELVLSDNASTNNVITQVSSKIDVVGNSVTSLRVEVKEHKQQTDASIAALNKRVAELETNLTLGVIANSPEGEKMIEDLRADIQAVKDKHVGATPQTEQKLLDQVEYLQQCAIKKTLLFEDWKLILLTCCHPLGNF